MRNMNCDSLLPKSNLDYINSIDCNTNSIYLGITFNVKWNKKIESDFNFLMIDSYILNNLSLSTTFFPTRSMGLNIGYYTFDYYINDYDYFFRQSQPAFHTYHDDNIFQKRIGDFGFKAGPAFRFYRKRIKLNFNLNFGITSNKKFTDVYIQKEINSNYKQKLKYETINSWNSLFYPEFKGEYLLLNRKKLNIGLQFRYCILIQDKSIDYILTTYRWTENNQESVTVKNPMHSFKKSEFDFGIIFAW